MCFFLNGNETQKITFNLDPTDHPHFLILLFKSTLCVSHYVMFKHKEKDTKSPTRQTWNKKKEKTFLSPRVVFLVLLVPHLTFAFLSSFSSSLPFFSSFSLQLSIIQIEKHKKWLSVKHKTGLPKRMLSVDFRIRPNSSKHHLRHSH